MTAFKKLCFAYCGDDRCTCGASERLAQLVGQATDLYMKDVVEDMTADAAMMKISLPGSDRRWYWATPGLFLYPGLYYWDAEKQVNVRHLDEHLNAIEDTSREQR